MLHEVEQYREQFVDWIAPLDPEFLRDKVVLDAGMRNGALLGGERCLRGESGSGGRRKRRGRARPCQHPGRRATSR